MLLGTQPTTPPLRRLLARSGDWAAAGVRLAARLVGDRLRGRASDHHTGARLRQFFEDVGGTAIKIGQQLSMRSDLFPPGVCAALSSLVDRVPPLDVETARRTMASEWGRPVEEVLADLEPTPIGSASVACVFRGHLLTGEAVAVKVQRPRVLEQFSEDLTAFNLATWLMEWASLVREGSFTHLRADLKIMFGEELDFRREARYQRLFRRFVRGNRLSFMRAPRTYGSLCTRRVMVSELVSGVSAATVLKAHESQDPEALARLAEQGIHPHVIARRFFMFSGWARFEAPFFHADPHPGNILLQPGDNIMLLDFGACGMTSRRTRLNQQEVVRLMMRGEASKIANVMLTDNGPLPYISAEALRDEMEVAFQSFVLGLNDKKAHWSERVISSVWLRMLEITREFQLRISLDTVRSIRAFLLYDTLAFRLNPSMSLDITRRYLRDAAWRQRRRVAERVAELTPRQHRYRAQRQRAELEARAVRMIEQLEPALQTAQVSLEQLGSNGARAARTALRVCYLLSLVGVALSAARLLGLDLSLSPTMRPALTLVGVIVLWRWTRMASFALRRVESGPSFTR